MRLLSSVYASTSADHDDRLYLRLHWLHDQVLDRRPLHQFAYYADPPSLRVAIRRSDRLLRLFSFIPGFVLKI